MSLYEVLVLVALASIGAFAYALYRKDTRGKNSAHTADAAPSLMFGRERTDKKS